MPDRRESSGIDKVGALEKFSLEAGVGFSLRNEWENARGFHTRARPRLKSRDLFKELLRDPWELPRTSSRKPEENQVETIVNVFPERVRRFTLGKPG